MAVKSQFCPPVVATKYHPPQKQNQAKTGFRKAFTIPRPKGTIGPRNSFVLPSNWPYWNCGKMGHWSKSCPYPQKNNQKQGNSGACQGHVNYTNMTGIPSGEVVTTSKFLVNQHPAVVLFDSSASHSFMSLVFASKYNQKVITLSTGSYCISAARTNISTNQVVQDVSIKIEGRVYMSDLVVLPGLGIDVILGMKWMSGHGVLIDTSTRVVMLRDPISNEAFLVPLPRDLDLHNTGNAIQTPRIEDVLVVCEFPDVFPDDLPSLPPDRDIEFKIELVPGTAPISRRPYRMPSNELAELKV
ncbi:uncharacterized protein [Miscanthus floridulus]|uniref:uncharacterized protein n=1 Tax=Miscanthus floridulus TaxID=154761 RepID=UPI003458F760